LRVFEGLWVKPALHDDANIQHIVFLKTINKHFEKKRQQSAQKRKPAGQGMCGVRTPVCLAQKMGKSMGRGPVLF